MEDPADVNIYFKQWGPMKMVLPKIEHKIFTVRGVQVMLDSDLAMLFGVETKRLNEQVKRNSKRFPKSFMFHLKKYEFENLRSQFATAKRRTIPYVFTEHGVAMLSAVLTTETAIKVSLQIVQAFIAMRKTLGQLHGVVGRLETVELKQLKTDVTLEKVLQTLEKDSTPRQGIFFEGQLFDATVFVSSLIKQAKKNIILVDNYVDESTLLLLSKRRKKVKCTIYSRPKAVLLKDLEKYNLQYPPIQHYKNHSSHDRFLIIDDTQLYHIGASLKDLGKKCFAFSRMDDLLFELRSNLLRGCN